ncbi:MAG: class I SAM-dependent methyltransferase [Bacteroidetes bacterium]|nr:MAG: class I SAM-dependent methyltransferase [Bacteroidota bacterium]
MLKITRYPETKNKSLQVSSAADNYLLNFLKENEIPKGNLALVNDRFGYLACHTADWNPYSVIAFKSQEKALRINFKNNNLELADSHLLSPLDSFPEKLDVVLLRIPKSLDLFKLYLHQIHQASHENTVILCSFMTKYFSKQMLKTAELFFEEVNQSLAWKKSRLLILKNPKSKQTVELLKSFQWQGLEIQQYLGVFSADKVDYATQFLLNNIKLKQSEQTILDLASGNGIIAASILNKYQAQNWETPELHLIDDSFLAVASSKFNLPGEKNHFHYSDDLEDFKDKSFDLVVSNPPFHFEYEINTEVTMDFFEQVYTVLKPNGRFILVFNRHLRYTTLLKRIFSKVDVMVDSPKFVVMECIK